MARSPRLAALLLLAALGLGGACGNHDATVEATPAEDAPTFVSGDFERIPVHPLAHALGHTSRKDGVVARSFVARNVARAALFAWYEERLDGWQSVEAPHALGPAPGASSRAIWKNDDQRLIMTVSDAPTIEGDPALQYSLSLEPADRDAG
jgi:hypothetical protein